MDSNENIKNLLNPDFSQAKKNIHKEQNKGSLFAT
jgi:hypothetical protein